jgi:hypothetical protein
MDTAKLPMADTTHGHPMDTKHETPGHTMDTDHGHPMDTQVSGHHGHGRVGLDTHPPARGPTCWVAPATRFAVNVAPSTPRGRRERREIRVREIWRRGRDYRARPPWQGLARPLAPLDAPLRPCLYPPGSIWLRYSALDLHAPPALTLYRWGPNRPYSGRFLLPPMANGGCAQ